MRAFVVLTCSKCGCKFTMDKGVQSQEEKESWERWAKDTYKSPYCPKCSKEKGFNVNTVRY